jgi:thiol-disulfide isomerase/thioredoxin
MVSAAAVALAACGAAGTDSAAPGASAAPSSAAVAQAGPTIEESERGDTETEGQPTKRPAADDAAGRDAGDRDPDDAAIPALSPANIVPAVEVVDVRSGGMVDLQSVVPAAQPVLLWAWAPHCPACRAEAPTVEAFAAAHQDAVTVVGIGTQDDLEYAEGFLADTGVRTPQMLWDPSFESWRQLGINAQPTFVLVDGSGEFLAGWVGGFPEDEVLALAAAA